MKQIIKKLLLIIITFSSIIFSACKSDKSTKNTASVFEENQAQLLHILEKGDLNEQQRYTIINQMATNYLNLKDYQGAVLFLTDWVEQNPNDMYNSYWLLMTAYAYLSMGAEPVAEYYFDRILQQYQDLLVKGNSIHFMCLQNLIQISKSPAHRIRYFNSLPDATTIQIPGEPDAYKNARHLIDYNSSDKKWTFETLEGLETAVRKAIRNYDWRSLDKYKAKVNFFSMSWKQDETDTNAQEEFSMRSFMRGNRIRCSDTLDPSSTPTEAYLRTTGWSTYVPVWYLYFRKVNFPLDSDIHGNWEWAGIYMGEKL